jgi:hypothetical protein
LLIFSAIPDDVLPAADPVGLLSPSANASTSGSQPYGLKRRSSPTSPPCNQPVQGFVVENRNRQRLKKNDNWSSTSLQTALKALNHGYELRLVARFFGIPPSSLLDHANGRTLTQKRRKGGVLTEEEARLVDYMMKMANLGYPLSMADVKIKVAEIVQERPKPFTDGIPSVSWVFWFRRRYPELVLRTSQGLR